MRKTRRTRKNKKEEKIIMKLVKNIKKRIIKTFSVKCLKHLLFVSFSVQGQTILRYSNGRMMWPALLLGLLLALD